VASFHQPRPPPPSASHGSLGNAVEAAVPKGKSVHAVIENYATRKHPKVKAWLARHLRWSFNFTPTSASW